jgi:hypothetical protein
MPEEKLWITPLPAPAGLASVFLEALEPAPALLTAAARHTAH